MSESPLMDDGSYDALVVDADTGTDGVIGLDLTIVAGPYKGEVVAVRATGLDGDPLDLLGLPVTLLVREGRPQVTFDQSPGD